MNIFEIQKKEKNGTLEILEDLNKSIIEVKTIEKDLKEVIVSLNSKHIILNDKIEKLDIQEIERSIDSNKKKLETQIVEMEKAVKAFKSEIKAEADSGISNYNKQLKISLYAPIGAFIVFIILITYGYFLNIRYIKGQVEEMAAKNNLLAKRIDQIHWLLVEDNKFWYDKDNKELYLNDNEWLRDYKKKIKNKKAETPARVSPQKI